jgi:transposase
MERMMKLQDVILKAMAKKISWMEAAEIAGVTDRTMRRMRERYQEFGYSGLFDQRRGKRSTHRIPMETAEEVLRLYREVYFDLNMRHFHEKLRDEHEIHLSYTWVQQALQGAGLVAKRRKRGPHRRRRPRRPLAGMLLRVLIRRARRRCSCAVSASPKCFSSKAASLKCASGKFGLKQMAARNASAARSHSCIPVKASPSRK